MVSTVACYRWGPGFKYRQERELIYFLLKRKFNLFKFEYHHCVGLWTDAITLIYFKSVLIGGIPTGPYLFSLTAHWQGSRSGPNQPLVCHLFKFICLVWKGKKFFDFDTFYSCIIPTRSKAKMVRKFRL